MRVLRFLRPRCEHSMAGEPDVEAVKAALRVLGSAGRADLLRPGVLDEARVGLTRAPRAAAQGVAVAKAACFSPTKGAGKKVGDAAQPLPYP
ncbi:hypothetical protein NDU88_010587 [Pleurodeles waltl]|uniref:Uncharacterized protein n=1 Tax=Pleurodeles waltl TaxID=8319 RepID=A0AAV7S130_PLEWA|nr:hypothetical protein NDU88_010587 [Pleurodeles waltl]